MLVRGNSKLGRSIWVWSIPASTTCPGKTELCDSRCYAQRGFYVMPSVKRAHERNLESSRMDDFAARIVDEINKKHITTLRIHSSGDFYSTAYIKKWHTVVKACPDTRFFTYTRSWRLSDMSKALTAFVKDCPNLKMWYSVDQQTGYPKRVPKGVRTAYMSVAVYDVPTHNTDLVFRDYGIRGTQQKYINGVLVCPPENGVSDLTCEQCGICWRRDKPVPKGIPDRRTPLKLVA
jgi:hypothetical protein